MGTGETRRSRGFILQLYKGSASMWMGYDPPQQATEDSKYRGPSVSISFTRSSGQRQYDKENQVRMSLTYWDVTKLLEAMNDRLEGEKYSRGDSKSIALIHKSGDNTKTLWFKTGTEGTWGWGIKLNDDAPISIYADEVEMWGGGYGILGFLRKCMDRMIGE